MISVRKHVNLLMARLTRLVFDGENPPLGVRCVGAVGSLEVHLLLSLLRLSNIGVRRRPVRLPGLRLWLGLDGKDSAFGVGGMSAIGALEVDLLRSVLYFDGQSLSGWPELLPGLRLG